MTVGTTINFELRMWIINSATNDDLYIKENGSYKEDSNGLILTKNFCSKVKITGTDTPYLTPPTAVDTLIKLTNNQNDSGLYTITHPADSTLQIGATESVTEYRYRGANPKNYVTFNNEVWRIIGVFPTDDGTGNIENRIKIVRNESIGNKYWDEGITSNWAGPATLNIELNTTYLNSLTSEAQNMIGNTKYYLGGKNVTYNNGYADTPLQFYSYERKTQNTTSNEFYNGTNPNSWVGKLGLMYVSDYGYASSNCENKRIRDTNSSSNDIRACNSTNWLFNNDYQWLLPQRDGVNAFGVESDGSVNDFYVYDDALGGGLYGVRPVLYLISSAQITGGNGTSSSPYTLGL